MILIHSLPYDILDVDTGVDDALAIIYGLESEKIDFLGITTVSGNVPVNMVTERSQSSELA